MPNSVRTETKRKLIYAIGNLENAQEKLAGVIDLYVERYPDIAYICESAATAIDLIKDAISKLEKTI